MLGKFCIILQAYKYKVMPNKIRIYNNTYSEIFPIPEGKEQELIARAKKYKMNYEISSSNPAQENNTPQAVPSKPMAQQTNNKAANNSNQVDFSEIDADTRLPIPNYMDSGIRLPIPNRKDSGTRLPIPTMSQSIQARDQKKDELVKQQWRKEEDKRKAENKRKSPMDLYKEEQVTENIKLATSPTYDAFGRDIATEEQLKAKEQLNKNQGVILSNSFLRPDKDGKIPSNTEGKGGGRQRVEMPQMEVDAEGNIQPYGWGEDNTDINKKILQGREYQKQVEQDRKQELYSNLQDKQELVITSNNDKERQSIRYRMLTDVNNIAITELQGLDALANQGKLSPFARNYLSHQISRTARKMQENGLNTFDAINRDNVEGLITLGWMSVVRNGLNAHFLNSLGEVSPEDKDSYMQAMDLISSADNSTSTSNVGYDMLNAVMQSLPYMGEFMLTGGISALGKEATKSVTKNVAKGLIKGGVKKKAAIKVGQYLGTNAPKLMAFSVASPFAYKHAQEKAIERVGTDFKLEDIKVSDILEGYAKSAIEFTVEGSGGLMKLGIDKLGIGKVVGNGRVGSFFSYLKNKTPEQIREIYKAAKFDGVGYQYAEEVLQNIVDTMVWDEMTWKEVFDPYNNFITLATCAIIQSPATVAQSGSYVKDKYKIHQDLGVVAADDRGVARELKRAMSMSDQSKRYEAVLNSGISNLKSVKAQKSAIDYVLRSEKMQFQKQVIDEERINTARREVIPIVTGLSYNNSIATVESNEGDKYFIVGETNQDTRLVPVRKIVTEKDANGNEFSRIEGIKRLVDFDKLDASTYLSTPYDEYVNRLVDSKLGNTRLQEQQQEIKAEELGMAVEQQTEAATMQDFQSIQEVQTQSEELGIEDKELREGSVVTIIGDSNEGNKRNFNVINTDGINAVIEDNESGLQHTLPLSVLNVEYQLTDKNEKEIKAVENAINGVETAQEEETLQVNTELQPPLIQEETIQEQQQDIYADFARDKNGEIDINNLSVEQQLTYAENEVGKDFAVNQATQVKNNLLKQIDKLNKKMPSMSLAKAVQVRKDIAKLEEEVGIYDIYINENSESPQKEEENLDLENKTYSERLSFLEEFAQIDPRAYVLYGIAAGELKFIWGGERGIAAELGFKRKNNQGEKKGAAGELRARISILSNKGYTADTLGEELGEEFHNIDSLQGRDIVIEALSEVNSKKDALLALESSYIKFNPEKDINYIAQLEQEEKAVQEAVAYENNIINAYWKYELQNLDERTKQIGILAETIGVSSDLIEETQSTYDLITLIEEYNGQNNNTTGNNGSNGVSRSEGTQTTGVEQGIREGEFDGRSEIGNSNSYQSSEENGLSNIQDEQTRNEVSYDTDKRGNDSEGYGKEQSENANQTLGEQRPQEIRDVSGSSNEEGNNVKEESNLPNGDDAIRSEEVYKGGISNTETGEPATSTIEDASQGDSQVGRPSLENQVQSIINKFIEDNNFKFKDVRLISKDSDEYRKTAGNKNATGWYLPRTNEVVIVYDNLGEDIENEVKKTYLHEILGHKTLREALDKKDYVPLMGLIYDAIPAFYKAEISKNQGKDIRNTVELELSEKGVTDKATIEQEYQKRLDEIVVNRIEREQAQYKDKIEYADEFLAVFTENYDNLTPESKKTLIDIIKDFFKRVFGIDADNNFFEDLVKLSYEIARGEKTAQGKIDKLNSMLNVPAVAELSKEELKVDTDPTEGQKEAGNYQKGHVKLFGFDITIENPKGSVRKGVDENGRAWESKMNNTYGYIKGTKGYDGDQVDVYIGDNLNSTKVFVIDQVSNGIFDEHKVMLGFDTEQEAKDNYLANYEEGWQGLGSIIDTSLEEFSDWVKNGTKKQKPFSDYSINKDTKEEASQQIRKTPDNKTSQENDIRYRNIENIKDRNRQVLRIDEYGKNIVWENGDYYIAVDSKDDATYISLWNDNKKIGFLTAQKGLDRIDGINPDDILLVGKVEIDKKHRGNGLSKPMYKALIDFSANNIKAIASYLPDRVNKKQVPEIWNSFGFETEDDYDYIRFREVPTNKNFVALHNIPEWKLAKVLRQGGFVNPSVAVTIPEIAPFKSYGEISFIAPKRLIDKKTGKNAGTFLGDAYTPRYPHVEYDISSRNIGKLNDRIYKNEILKKYNLSSFVSSRILSDVGEKGIDEIQLSLAVKLLFLAERGIDTIQVEKRKYSDNELKELKDLDFANKEIFGIKDSKEDKEVLTKLWESKNKDKYEDFEDAKQKLYEDGNVPILIMRNMLTEIKSEINSPVRANFFGNLSNANRYIIDNNLNQEAEKFAYDLYNSLDVKEQIFDGFTPSGNRRYLANTIQNASKLMKKDGLEGAEGWNHGLGSLRALVVPKLTSTDKLSKFRSLIVSEDEFETIKVDLEDVYDNISNELRGENEGWDTGNYRLSEVINLSNPSEYLNKEYDLEISDELNNQIKEFRTQLLSMPTEYFETKFQRPVYVAEFSGVLIPSNASEEVKSALNRIGIKVKEYTEDSERQTKLNELIDDLEASEQIRFRENKQFQSEQHNTQKISNKTYANFNLNEEIRFRIGNKARANYDEILKAKRPDLSKECINTFLEYLDGIDDKKKEKVTFNWFAKGTIIVPEDMYKVEQAIKVADIKKIDPMQFNSPMEIIDKFSDVKIKGDRINPDNVKTLSNKVDYGNGITVYNVSDSEQGRKDMREIINTHFGKKSSPWCLLQGNENGVLTSQSKDYWKHYNKITKRVAFLNGKLLAFSANDKRDVIWWDKADKSHEGVPITQRIPNDELKRTGTMLFDEETKQLGKPYNILKGDKINGLYEEWYENGQLWKRINYKDGKEDGLYENWDGNGQLWRRINFKDGKKDGLYEEWQQNGQLKNRINFKDGNREGLYEDWYDNGQLSERVNYKDRDKDGLSERWYNNGQLWDRINYKDGSLNGLYEDWYENGQPKKRINYKDWNKDGLCERWYDNGQLEERSNYKDGELNGLYEMWYKNGQPKERSNYKDGRKDGLYEKWYDNGRLSERINYKDGNKEGLYEKFDGNSKITHSVIYSNGVLIKDNQKDEDVRFRKNNPIQSKIDRFNELLNGESNNRYRTINIDGKERPTINSLGKPIASTEEGLRNFWKWFGDSKVVDSEGLPLVVWRGENADYEEYIKGDISFFTDNKYSAIGYGDGQAFAEYLSFKNPLNIMNLDDKKYVESVLREFQDSEYNAKEVDSVKIYDKGINVFLNRIIKNQFNEFMDFAKSKGYDSVISFDSDVSGQNRIAQYISSSPNQIKSINNVGTFDPENEDIRFRERYENSGYNMREDGTYASVNAIDAEKGGTFTAGVFKRKYGVSAKDFDGLTELGFIKQNEWHHTGKSFREADFYSWADSERVNGDVSYNEEGSWDSEEGNSLAGKYADNKKEISKLTKQLEDKEWQYKNKQEEVYIPTLDIYINQVALKNVSLSDKEKEEKEKEHTRISTIEAQNGVSSYERRLMHEKVDYDYNQILEDKVAEYVDNNRDKLEKEYYDKYQNDIDANKNISKVNDDIKRENIASNGKESILMNILDLMGYEEDKYSKVSNLSKYEQQKIEDREKERIIKEEKEKNRGLFEAQRKEKEDSFKEWFDDNIKQGNIERVERVSVRPSNFIEEKREMNGKYGWFDSSSKSYNLPEYYSGISFATMELYQEYRKRIAEINEINNEIRFRSKDKSKAKIERFNALLNEEYEDEKEKKKKTFEDRKNEAEIAYFNKFKPLKDIHEKLTEDGFYIPFNVYQRTVSADSRINTRIEKLDETLGKDLKESIAKVQKKGGFSYDEIGIYFQAQFMPERTAQLIQKRIEKDFVLNRIDKVIKDLKNKKAENFMDLVMPAEKTKKANDKIDKSLSKLNKAKEERTEKIRNKLQERGLAGEQGLKELMERKGFPDVTPEDYIQMFEKEVGDTELINELNGSKKAIVNFTLDTAFVTGQISKEQYAEYTSSENYVPLRGWDITFDDSGEDNIFQSVSKAAKGRKSLAANPINYLYAMAYTAVTFGEKNILKNNLATLVLMNRSNPNFMDNFGYNTFYSGYLVDEEGNEVPFEVSNEDEFNALEGVIKETLVIRMNKEKFDNLNSQKNPHKYDEEYKKHILTFYDDGIRHELYIEDINLVNAFKSDKLTRTQANMKRATSYVTKFMTSRNISFIPANLIRDIQTTMFLNKYFDDAKKDAAFKAQIIKNMRKVGKTVIKGVWKNDWNTDNEIGKIYNEWLLGGGRTGWLQSFKDVADIEKKVKRDIANTNKVSEWLSNRYHFKATEACAEFSENLVRFSVYYTAIQNGFTKEQSIWFSNDASLNFNLKGAKGNWLRAIYGFWNASLAGFYKVGKFTWENKGKAAATFAFFMAAGFGKWWLDQLDDDEEKRSEYKKQRMFDLFGVGIPMSYDLLPPYRIGYMLADVIFGDMTNTKFGYETAMSFTEIMPEQVQTALSFISKYNPKRDKIEWANLEELAGLTPTALKPLVEGFFTNKNFMGQDIKPENKFKDLPDSAKYKEEQVTALDKLVANMINGLYGFDWKDYDEESKFTSTGRKRPSVLDVSPAVIHHLVSSYYSGTAQLITGSSDAITMATDDKEDGFNKISGKIPVINRFYIPTNESLPLYKKMEQMQAKYSDLLENHKEITRVLNDKKSTQEEKASYRKRLQVLKKNPLYNEAIRYKRREDDIRDLRKQLRLANKLGKYEQANKLKMKLDKIDREINNK